MYTHVHVQLYYYYKLVQSILNQLEAELSRGTGGLRPSSKIHVGAKRSNSS